eukprot:scaffold60091_cov28-Tisochrysis_lutea.AAC.1
MRQGAHCTCSKRTEGGMQKRDEAAFLLVASDGYGGAESAEDRARAGKGIMPWITLRGWTRSREASG